jgi:hypothetical protein
MLIQIDPISQCDHTCAEQMKQSRPSSVSLATPKVLKARISELSYCRKNIVLLKINIMQREGVGCQTTFTTYTHFLSPHYSLQSNGIFHCLVYNKLYIWNEKIAFKFFSWSSGQGKHVVYRISDWTYHQYCNTRK